MSSILAIYKENRDQDHSYRFLDETEQAKAHGLLRELGLDSETLNSLLSKYGIQWSKVIGKGETEEKKELYSREYTKKKVYYNSNFDLFSAPFANWRDTLNFVMTPHAPNPEELPHVCR